MHILALIVITSNYVMGDEMAAKFTGNKHLNCTVWE